MNEQQRRWFGKKARQAAVIFFASQGVMSTLWMGKGLLFGRAAQEQTEFLAVEEETPEAATPEEPSEAEGARETLEAATPEEPSEAEEAKETLEAATPEEPSEAEGAEETHEAETPEDTFAAAIQTETAAEVSLEAEGVLETEQLETKKEIQDAKPESVEAENVDTENDSAKEEASALIQEKAEGIGKAGLEKIRNELKREAAACLGDIRYSMELQNAAAMRLFKGEGSVMDVLTESGARVWKEYTWKECEVYAYLVSQEEDAYQALTNALSSAWMEAVKREDGFTEYGIGLSVEESEGAYLVKAVMVFVKKNLN